MLLIWSSRDIGKWTFQLTSLNNYDRVSMFTNIFFDSQYFPQIVRHLIVESSLSIAVYLVFSNSLDELPTFSHYILVTKNFSRWTHETSLHNADIVRYEKCSSFYRSTLNGSKRTIWSLKIFRIFRVDSKVSSLPDLSKPQLHQPISSRSQRLDRFSKRHFLNLSLSLFLKGHV